MIGIDAEYIAFTRLPQVPLEIADPVDAIGPAERHASCKSALDHLGCKLRLGRKADVARHVCGLQASRIVGPPRGEIEDDAAQAAAEVMAAAEARANQARRKTGSGGR